jgi:hypothetical protein
MENTIMDILMSGSRFDGMVVGAVVGGLFGLIGAIVAFLIQKLFKRQNYPWFIVFLFVVVSFQIPNMLRTYYAETYENKQNLTSVNNAIDELKVYEIYSLIFRLDPSAEKTMRSEFATLIEQNNEDMIFIKAQEITSNIINTNLLKFIPTASTESIHSLLVASVRNLRNFQYNPTLCVNYYLGENFSYEDTKLIDDEFIKNEANLKAQIIKSAIDSPKHEKKFLTIDEIFQQLEKIYREKGYDIENIIYLESLGELPPAQGCKIATEFSEALISLPENDSVLLFKSLMIGLQE